MSSVGLTTILFVAPGVCLIGCFIYYYTGGEDGPMTTVLSYFNTSFCREMNEQISYRSQTACI